MKVTVIGLGPGGGADLTGRARAALEACDLIVGYTAYIDLVRADFPQKETLSTGMRREVDRCRAAVEAARTGKDVAVVCSGDSGVYGMAGLIYEVAQEYDPIEIEVVPGITAACGGAAVLGAPLTHDFAVVSLSDLLTPWEKITARLTAAAQADFVLCLYNPASHSRPDYLRRACDILLSAGKDPATVCGTVHNIGRALAEWMAVRGIPHTVCVATEYGETLLPAGEKAHVGRMDSGEMEALMRAGGYSLTVDATHPYAVEVTEHIRAAAEAAGLPVLRLVRQSDGGELCRRAKDMAGAADMLEQMPGHVLLTTGSKELHHFARPGLAERCYPRVLPMADSLERCLTLGFPPKNIICMQGPFSRELNVALLRQYHIQTLVTKDTGGYGGFREKAEAAREAGCALLVVERPSRETGLTLEEIQKKLMEEENA